MRRRMLASPFEFAPDAARYHPLGWALLLASSFALVAGACLAWQAHGRLEKTQTQHAQALQQQRTHDEQDRRNASDPVALEKSKAQQQLEGLLQMPWSLLMDALEASSDAVEGRVTLLSMSPGAGTRKVELSLLATNHASMLAYVEAMKEVSGFTNVRISSHQTDDRVGPGAMRFKVSAAWTDLKEGVFLNRQQAPNAKEQAR